MSKIQDLRVLCFQESMFHENMKLLELYNFVALRSDHLKLPWFRMY